MKLWSWPCISEESLLCPGDNFGVERHQCCKVLSDGGDGLIEGTLGCTVLVPSDVPWSNEMLDCLV